MKKENQKNSTSIKNIIRFLLIGSLLLSGMESVILYASASIWGYMTIASWLACWCFSLITLCGIPLTLMIDGLAGTLYEKWGNIKTKSVFLFTAKTIEVLLLVSIVHQADEWLKGITCSIWSETFIGYGIFLLLEGVFALGNWISSRLAISSK